VSERHARVCDRGTPHRERNTAPGISPEPVSRAAPSLNDVHRVSSIVYDPHGPWFAFAIQAGARFGDVASAKQFLVVDVGRSAFGPKQVYALSPDGRRLGALREDGAVEFWRLPADREGALPTPRMLRRRCRTRPVPHRERGERPGR
jgi:hypothetical protein